MLRPPQSVETNEDNRDEVRLFKVGGLPDSHCLALLVSRIGQEAQEDLRPRGRDLSQDPKGAHPIRPLPAVGGRLLQFAEQWKILDPDNWVQRTISEGYKIEFSATPPTSGLWKTTPIPQDPSQRQALEKEIADLLYKRAIRKANQEEAPLLYRSSFFLTPKKPNTWRPILNLKPLNKQFIRPRRFRMETLASIIPSLGENLWATSIDLKDAYLHVPVHPSDQRFLAFNYQGVDFVFQAMPFGLSTAPHVFTRVTRAITAFLRRRGITVFAYLDDWLIVSRSRPEAQRDTEVTTTLLRRLGWIINLEKSSLNPSQNLVYLGARLDLLQGMLFASNERQAAVSDLAVEILSNKANSAFHWLRLLGLLASLVDVLPLCRLKMRPLQLCLLHQFHPSSDLQSKLISVTPQVRPYLAWWADPHIFRRGRPCKDRRREEIMTTDASLSGWGATWRDSTIAGKWSPEEQTWHINVLELTAVKKALSHWDSDLRDCRLTVLSDNSTVVSYLNKQGGTKSPSLCWQTIDLISRADSRNILLRATHLAGKENIVADALSRGWRLDDKEWTLDQKWADHVFRMYDRPHIDLFAAAGNSRLPTFCSRFHHPQAWATDALAQDWTGFLGYAFPPWNLIYRVLTKVRDSQTKLILIAPCWPRQPWFPLLLRLLTDNPFQFPPERNLLTQLQGRVVHPHVTTLHLTAWPISGIISERQDFQRRLLTSPPIPGDPPPFLSMTLGPESTGTGQFNTVSIPWKLR